VDPALEVEWSARSLFWENMQILSNMSQITGGLLGCAINSHVHAFGQLYWICLLEPMNSLPGPSNTAGTGQAAGATRELVLV